MEWTKIPTDLLQSRLSDKEIIAITKYQLLWAMLERKPNRDICLRYMTEKQLQQALNYASAIECRINADIKSVESHRKRQKLFYIKNQALNNKTDGQYDCQYDGQSASSVTEQIREDKKREDNNPSDKTNDGLKEYYDYKKFLKILEIFEGKINDKDTERKWRAFRNWKHNNNLTMEDIVKMLSRYGDYRDDITAPEISTIEEIIIKWKNICSFCQAKEKAKQWGYE